MKESQNTASKAERLKDILKGFGIKTAKTLTKRCPAPWAL